MQVWNDLVTSALIGTERQEPRLPEGGSGLTAALAALAGREPEARLLAAAGVVSLYRRAGQLPEKAEGAAPEAAGAEEQPLCSPRAAHHLEVMLGGRHRAALPE